MQLCICAPPDTLIWHTWNVLWDCMAKEGLPGILLQAEWQWRELIQAPHFPSSGFIFPSSMSCFVDRKCPLISVAE